MAKASNIEMEERKGEIIIIVNNAFDKNEKCPSLDDIAAMLNEKFKIGEESGPDKKTFKKLQRQNIFQYLKGMDDKGEIINNLFRSEIITDHIIESKVKELDELVNANIRSGSFIYREIDYVVRWLLRVQRYSIERYLSKKSSSPFIDSIVYELSDIVPEYITLAALIGEIDDGILGLSNDRIIKEDNRLDDGENNLAEIVNRILFSFQKTYQTGCQQSGLIWLFHYVFENSESVDANDTIALETKVNEILLQSLEKGLIIETPDNEYVSTLKVNNESFCLKAVSDFIEDEFDETEKPVEFDKILSVLFEKSIEDKSQLIKDILKELEDSNLIRESGENRYVPSSAQEDDSGDGSDVAVIMEKTANLLYDKLKRFPTIEEVAMELCIPVNIAEFTLKQLPKVFTIKDKDKVLTAYIRDEYNKRLMPVDTASLPIYGMISCGPADEQRQEPMGRSCKVPIEFDGKPLIEQKKSYYVLRTYGDSMIGANISDGDYILIEECPGADPFSLVNKVIVAKDENEQTTLKTLKSDKDGKLYLHAENDEIVNGERKYPDMYKERIEVQGVWTKYFAWKQIK